jgi:hypothetical protein
LNNIRFMVLPAPAPSPGGKTEMPAAENAGLRLSVDQRLEREFRRSDLSGESDWIGLPFGSCPLEWQDRGCRVVGAFEVRMPLLPGERI